MASIVFASISAAQTAGYSLLQTNRGNASSEQYFTQLEKYVGGVAGDPGAHIRAYGYGTTQALADAAALASVNAQRINRFGGDSASLNTSAHGIAPNAAGSATGPGRAATASVRHTVDGD